MPPKKNQDKANKGKLNRRDYDGYDLPDEFEGDDEEDKAYYDKYAKKGGSNWDGDDYDCSDYDGNTYGTR